MTRVESLWKEMKSQGKERNCLMRIYEVGRGAVLGWVNAYGGHTTLVLHNEPCTQAISASYSHAAKRKMSTS